MRAVVCAVNMSVVVGDVYVRTILGAVHVRAVAGAVHVLQLLVLLTCVWLIGRSVCLRLWLRVALIFICRSPCWSPQQQEVRTDLSPRLYSWHLRTTGPLPVSLRYRRRELLRGMSVSQAQPLPQCLEAGRVSAVS